MANPTLTASALSALDLYKKLQEKFNVSAAYTVGFNQELSEDVKDIIKHLKGDLYAEDIIPNGPTKLSVVLKTKDDTKIVGVFNEDSAIYMEAFDKTGFRDFATKHLS